MRAGLLLAALAGAALAAQPAEMTAPAFLAHVRFLSDDALGGRGNGTEGLERAAAYLRDAFRAAGLSGGNGGAFDQPFDADVVVEPSSTAAVVVRTAAGVRRLALGREFHPLSAIDRAPGSPGPGLDEARVVFAGYGISAPGLGYDDYAGVDVKGTAVLVLTHEPQEHDERSVFDGRRLTPGAAISAKAREARERGAGMLMVVEDPTHADDRAMRGAWWTDPQADAMGIPVIRIAREEAAQAFAGLDLAAAAASIDRTLTPRSRALDGVAVSYVEERRQFTARLANIVGVLEGADPVLAREAVVVGAHYDHVGTGGRYSEAPAATGDIHNGADDNASGVAALIEVARAAGRRPARFRRTVVFAAFAGEELGLTGSAHYVAHPVRPIDRTVAMLNLDMVGRAEGRLLVGLFGTRAPVAPLLARLAPWTTLRVRDFRDGGYEASASDGGSFAARGVPVVAFFTGFHSDYHRPSDDWPRIDAEGGAEIGRLALRLVEHFATQANSAWR